jgi:SAM-dependent methyltransferase
MKLRFHKTIEKCNPIEGKTVIDFGCGPGLYSIVLAKMGAQEVLGVDFSEKMIRIARSRAVDSKVSNKCSFITDDINNLETKKKYNYGVVMGVMDYIENPENFIKKITEIVTERIVFSFPVDGGVLAWQRKLRYKSRCKLIMYNIDKLEEMFNRLAPKSFKIEKIARDYFVTMDMKDD